MKRTRNTTPMKILQRLLVTLLLSLGLWGSAAALAQTITYFHTDISGSPMVATDEAGEVVWKEQYSPYGDKIERALASNSNRIGYHGQAHDDHTGLSYMGARYYDPVLGRFMGVDPVGFVDTNLHSANRYAYANNNPYRYVDPDGRSPIAIELAKDGGIVGGVVCGPICGGVGAVAGLGLGLWGTYEANKLLSEGSKGDEEAEGGNSNGGKDASTPTGRKGSPIEVKPGTNEPANIGGRDYTGHALDRMQGRGVPPSAVEDAIQNGNSKPSRDGTSVHTGDNGVTVVTGDRGRVITVIPR